MWTSDTLIKNNCHNSVCAIISQSADSISRDGPGYSIYRVAWDFEGEIHGSVRSDHFTQKTFAEHQSLSIGGDSTPKFHGENLAKGVRIRGIHWFHDIIIIMFMLVEHKVKE